MGSPAKNVIIHSPINLYLKYPSIVIRKIMQNILPSRANAKIFEFLATSSSHTLLIFVRC